MCDNVRTSHALNQTGTVNDYVLKFEQSMNLITRDNPALPQDYYKASFIAGLSDNIQHHVQCHEPPDLQKAIWLARRIEQAQPAKKIPLPFLNQAVRRQIKFDPRKQPSNSTATKIQQEKMKGICYKWKDPWFQDIKRFVS